MYIFHALTSNFDALTDFDNGTKSVLTDLLSLLDVRERNANPVKIFPNGMKISLKKETPLKRESNVSISERVHQFLKKLSR